MKLDKPKALLFIHPAGRSEGPTDDDLARKLASQMSLAEVTGSVVLNGSFVPGLCTLGLHTCTGEGCGAKSRSYDILLPCGLATNTLSLHYLRYHRAEVPPKELAKVAAMPPPSEGFCLESFDENAL